MSTSPLGNYHVTFLGQNSHGSDESWRMRRTHINELVSDISMAVVIECPTIDLILYALKRYSFDETTMAKFLASSTYWWMRSAEFRKLLMNLPPNADIFGIDVPYSISQHTNCISVLNALKSPVGRLSSDLLIYDMITKDVLSSVTAEQREIVMTDKLSIILEANYQQVVVICHNFHATRYSWLPYRSLCQRIIDQDSHNISVKSCGVFSQDMAFIATPDGKNLETFRINDACVRCGELYQVKMVSSYYRSEQQDALSMSVRVPLHYDEVIVYPSGHPITVEGNHG
ncbi:hypothetical protein [Pectobacterium polaris]|uniref:hypothetical protein n=1 Tax=Pectobacterium polaris TaxID=2042057 RepID=UPI00202D6288|nr:hypothetical protein [Pectobacterium polaris]MCL6326009.1 hypothetical protein [Pectobacterium polaris]